ncbi:MAG: 50S ribosomal protein L21 [Flavobacteriales bacterium AspAUS03]
MFAIMEIGGLQYKVTQGHYIYVPRLKQDEGTQISFDRVLLLDQEGVVTVGAPVITGAGVQAKILQHIKGDKIIVFKKKRRKGYKVKHGHRQQFTKIEVLAVTGGETIEKKPAKKATPKVREEDLQEKVIEIEQIA